jgi:sugar lactone lactonase YvrE
MLPSPKCAVDCRNLVGESPVFDKCRNYLWWTDIEGRCLWNLDLGLRSTQKFAMPGRVGSLGICQSGQLVLAMEDRICLFAPENYTLRDIARIEVDIAFTRLNDGKVGPDGAFWVGTMDQRPERQPISNLYRVTRDGKVERKISGLGVSNGLAWSADGCRMYHADSWAKWVDLWDFDPYTGNISARRRFLDLNETTGIPDGGACDANDVYWSAGLTSACLNGFAPDGRLTERIPLPIPFPTMPCFAGSDLKTVFVTSLTLNRPKDILQQHPDAGGLTEMEFPIAGTPIHLFQD